MPNPVPPQDMTWEEGFIFKGFDCMEGLRNRATRNRAEVGIEKGREVEMDFTTYSIDSTRQDGKTKIGMHLPELSFEPLYFCLYYKRLPCNDASSSSLSSCPMVVGIDASQPLQKRAIKYPEFKWCRWRWKPFPGLCHCTLA
jgi:hypothetical protein